MTIPIAVLEALIYDVKGLSAEERLQLIQEAIERQKRINERHDDPEVDQ